MSKRIRDGRPTGVTGTITADSIKTALGIGAEPRSGRVLDTPAQARLRSEGKDREADALASDDFEVTILDAAEHYALWGSPELSAPQGSPDGTPVPLPPTAKPRPQKTDWRKIDGEDTTPAPPAPTPNEQAAELRAMAAEHARRQVKRTEEAIRTGTPEQKAAAAKEAETTATLLTRIRERIGPGSQ